MKNNSYLQFWSIVHGSTNTTHDLNLDERNYQLFALITLHVIDEKPFTVSDSMNLDAIASPATVHRYLKKLEEEHLIEFIYQGSDRRTKYLKPTKKAFNYFSKSVSWWKKRKIRKLELLIIVLFDLEYERFHFEFLVCIIMIQIHAG